LLTENTMKIYRFNPDTGIYLGEDFADEALLKEEAFLVPPDATPVAPPCPEPGYVAIFDFRTRQWKLCNLPSSAEQLRRARLEDDNEPEVYFEQV
jgi:hypothetical protein